MKTGYCIKTQKYKIRCSHPEWLAETERYYRQVLEFYYRLLLDHEALWEENLLQIQRGLECLTIPGRDGRQPEYPLPFEKVPVYFRRSAINKAAGNLKSYIAKVRSQEHTAVYTIPDHIDASVTYFKGMYRELSDTAVTLKVWDGSRWQWMDCRLRGRNIPEGSTLLSPAVICSKKDFWLHIPIKQETQDARNAKERMKGRENICSIQFTNTDIIAMCCVMDAEGKQKAVFASRGGDSYRNRCREIQKKIENSRIYTDRDHVEKPNRRYYERLKHISEYQGHRVSREIIDFCIREDAKVIVLPSYDEGFSKMVRYKSGRDSPLHLGGRIRECLRYKAWEAGILVLELHADHTSSQCFLCGGRIKKKGSQYVCENGHEGSRFLNSARNLGMKCLKDFEGKRKIKKE